MYSSDRHRELKELDRVDRINKGRGAAKEAAVRGGDADKVDQVAIADEGDNGTTIADYHRTKAKKEIDAEIDVLRNVNQT